ncbi:MAG: hypothetical protein AB8G23_21735 [Myxococcota bacterium]
MNNANELRLQLQSSKASVPTTAQEYPRRFSRPSGDRNSLRGAAVLAVFLMLGFLASPASAWSGRVDPPVSPQGPGAVFFTLEAAALDALRFASGDKNVRARGRFQGGTIFQVDGGFSYRVPSLSRGTVWSLAAPVVRFEYGGAGVASYVVHPRSGRASLDRANEGLQSATRRRIERSDSQGRPLFLLTPKGRVIRYSPGEKAEVISSLDGRKAAALLP